MNNRLYTIQEAADILGVSTKTLRRWDQRGRFVPTRTAGNQRRYTQQQIAELKTQNPKLKTARLESVPEPFFQPQTPKEFKPVQGLQSVLSSLPSNSFLKRHFLLRSKDGYQMESDKGTIKSRESLKESSKPAKSDLAKLNPFRMGLMFAGIVLIFSLAGSVVLTRYNVIAGLPRLTADLSQTGDRFAKFINNLSRIGDLLARRSPAERGEGGSFIPQGDIVGSVLAAATSTSDLILNVNVPTFFSQKVGIGTATVDPSAALDLTSEDKGFLAPRMTETQRDAITSPAAGLFMYNTDTNQYNMYDGKSWKAVGGITAIGDVTTGEAFAKNGTEGNSLYFHGTGGGVGQLTGGAISGTQTYTLPGATGTFITTGNLTDITKVGTIGSGVWNGTTITVANGGTGATTLTGILLGNGTSAITGLTTSLGISGAISDETGTGALVFGTSPAITTSLTTASTSFALINTAATTVNFAGAATTLSIGSTTGTATINNAATAITGALTANGNVTLGDAATDTITFTGRVAQGSSLIPIGTTGTNDLGSSALPWDNLYADNIVTGSSGVSGYWQRTSSALSPTNITDDLLLGATSTSSAKFGFINIAGGTPTATISGNLSLAVPTTAGANTFNLLNNSTLNFQRSPGGDAGLATALFIANDGKIGIGTTAPGEKLTISASTTGDVFSVGKTDTVSSGEHRIAFFEGGSGGSNWTGVAIGYRADGTNVTRAYLRSNLSFPLDFGTTSFPQAISILESSGNVGIGNTAPLTKLDITGSASLSANLSLKGAGTAHTFNILDNGTLNLQRSPGGDAGLATALFIQGDGNVGIGTTSPASFKAEVAGDIGPEANNTRNLGSSSKYFNTAYITNIVSGTSGTVGYWTRASTTLSPNTAGDSISSTGSISDTPATNATALTLTGTNVTSANLAYFNAKNTSGTIFNIAYGAAATLAGDLVGQAIDLNNGKITDSAYSVTGFYTKLPTITADNAAGTVYLKGIAVEFGTGSGINQTGAGALTYTAGDFLMPAITQTAGTLTANGVLITTPSSITTGGTANGVNISPTGVGAGTLNGINIGTISSAGAGTETAIAVGTGWDNVLKVGSTVVANGSGVVQVAAGGTNLTSYTAGDMLYASDTTILAKLAGGTANNGKVLVVASGLPSWGTMAGSSCTDCLINDPSSTQTLAPTGSNTTGLTIRQTSTALDGNTPDMFSVASSDGATKYFSVDYQGNVSTGAIANTTLTLTPTTDTTALTLVGTNVATSNLQYINSKNLQGTISNIAYGAAATLNNNQTLTGQAINLSTNVTANASSTNTINVTAQSITLPAVTNTNTSGTNALKGIVVSAGGGLNQNGTGGTTTFSGADITMPALTQSAGTLTANGVLITTPSSITTGGTANGVNISTSGVGAGTLNGINIGAISGGSGAETAINVGTGWDYAAIFAGGNVGIGDTSPDALLDLDSADTDGGDFLITNTGIGLSGTVAGIISNSTTTGDILTISSTGLTTGTALTLTGPTSTGVTDHFVKITSDVGASSALIYGAPDFSGSAVTSYGLNITATDSTANENADYGIYSSLALTGNAAKTGIGLYSNLSTSSTIADTLAAADLAISTSGIITTGTRSIYGLRAQPASTAASTGGTTNVYGVYSKAAGVVGTGGVINAYGLYVANGTMSTTGTSVNTGLYVESPTGADTNYAAIFAGGSVGIGNTAPLTALDVTGSASLSANLSLKGSGTAHTFNILDNGTLNFTRSPGGDAVATTSLFIQGAGNVGIGTTGPGSILDVLGTITARNIRAFYSTGDPDILIGDSAGVGDYGRMYWDSANDRLNLGTQTGGDTITITEAGNVGIGTTAPTSFLHVDGAATAVTAAFARAFVDNTNAITTNTGGTAVYGLMIDEPNITVGTATPTTSAALYISGAATEATTNYGIQLGAMSGATSTGLDIGALSGTTANKGINIGAISGTGATGGGITIGNISTTGTTNYGLQLGTMTGGTTSNYQINTGVLTSATTTTNAQLNLGGVVTTGGTTNYGINVGALSGTGTTNYGINIAASTATGTTNYGMKIGAISGAATTNYGLYVDTISGATSNYAAIFAGGNVGIGTTAPGAKLDIEGGNLDMSSNNINNIATANFIASGDMRSAADNSVIGIYGGQNLPWGAGINLYGKSHATSPGVFLVSTPNAANDAQVERLKITGKVGTADFLISNSNVGIGNTAPLTALDITGSASLSANLSLRGSGTAHTFNILQNGTLNFTRSPGGDAVATTSLFIQGDGNVGIGTTAPTAKLDVNGTVVVNNTITGWTSLVSQNGIANLDFARAAGNQMGQIRTYSATYDTFVDRLGFYGGAAQGSSKVIIYEPIYGGIAAGADLYLRSTDNATKGDVLIADDGGNVGIGTTAPLFGLDLRKSQTATAAAQIFNTGTGTDDDGLILKLGNTSTTAVATTNHFLSFETFGIGIVGSVQGSGGKGVTYATSGVADFAEYFKKDQNQNIPYGSVVCLKDNGFAVPCNNDSNKIIGVASERPAFLGGENLGDRSIAVGLVGQVRTRVSTANGEIKIGDPLTTSLTDGIAVKATSVGQILGKALESFADGQGEILVSVNISWYNPSIYVSYDGTLSGMANTVASIGDQLTLQGDALQSWQASASARLQSLEATASGGQAKTDYILANDPLFKESQNKVADLQSKFDLLSLRFEQQASISAFLSEIVNSQVLGASTSAALSLGDVELNNATISDNLMVLGRTTVTDLGVTGNINAGLLSIHGLDPSAGSGQGGATIGTLAGDLYLQPEGLGGVDILSGKVVIDTQGNMKVTGTITANEVKANNYTVLGDQSIGSATIPAGSSAIEVSTAIVSSSSKIFLTATSLTDKQITVVEKTAGRFKVAIPEPTTSPISFDWWIVGNK